MLAAQGTTGPRSGSHNKSFSWVLQPIDFAGLDGAYLFDPKHLQQGFAMSVDIGGRLRFVRARHKLSQRELAKRSGVTNSTISLIESNQMNPSVGALKRILDGLPMGLAERAAVEIYTLYRLYAIACRPFFAEMHHPDRWQGEIQGKPSSSWRGMSDGCANGGHGRSMTWRTKPVYARPS